MPFTKDDFILCLAARTADKTLGRFTDESPYSVGANQARNATANIVLVAKMDSNQNLVFTTVVPDDVDPLVSMNYTFTTIANAGGKVKDGAYRAFLIAHNFWLNSVNYQPEIVVDSVVTQYGDIIYHVASEKFYKAIAISGPATTFYEPSVTLGWEDFWEEYTGNWQAEILNDQLVIHIHDDIVTFNFEDCLKDELSKIADDILDDTCTKIEDLLKPVKMALLLDESNSQNWQSKQPKADIILIEATKKFCC